MGDVNQQTPGQTGPSPAFPIGDDFSNDSERNAAEQTDSQTAWEVNRKRTYDEYQDIALTSARRSQVNFDQLNNVALQALTNSVETANMIGKQAVKHADVAADALWTDELNPVVRGAGDVLAGQSPVNSQLSSTASLDVVFNNLSAQLGTLITGYVTQAQSLAQSNVAITNANAAMVALLAQLIQNAKQPGTGSPASAA